MITGWGSNPTPPRHGAWTWSLLIALALALTLTGCAGPDDLPQPAQTDATYTSEHRELSRYPEFYHSTGADAYVYETPGDMAKDRAVVIEGVVDGTSPGAFLSNSDANGDTRVREGTALLHIKVLRWFKAVGAPQSPGAVDVVISRGAELEGKDGSAVGEGGASSMLSVPQLSGMLPAGTRVLIMANPWTGANVRTQATAEAASSILLSGWHPQTITVAAAKADDRNYAGWGSTFEEVLASVVHETG